MPNKKNAKKKVQKKAMQLARKFGMGPTKIGPQRVPSAPKKRNKKKKKKGFRRQNGPLFENGAWSQRVVSDGINSGLVTQNNTVITNHFPLRREKICDIKIPSGYAGGFTLLNGQTGGLGFSGIYINPGNIVMVPIFATIASTYEEYEINSLAFVYETLEYTGVGTGAYSAGKVCMATNYNPDSSTFSDMTEMENYQGSIKGPPYARRIVHRVDVGRAKKLNPTKVWYVNNSVNDKSPSGDTQAKAYNLGFFQFGIDALPTDMPAGTQLGELYIEFSFTMIRAKQTITADNFSNSVSATVHAVCASESGANAGTCSATNRFGVLPMVVETDSNEVVYILPGANEIQLNEPGRYVVDATWANSTNITSVPTVTYGGSVVAVNELNHDAGNIYSTFTGAIATLELIVDVISAGIGAANAINVGGLAGLTGGLVDLLITRVSSIFLLSSMRAKHPRLWGFKRQFVWDPISCRNVPYVVHDPPKLAMQTKLSELERQMKMLLDERKATLDREYDLCHSGRSPLVPPRNMEAARIEAYESKSQTSNSKRL